MRRVVVVLGATLLLFALLSASSIALAVKPVGGAHSGAGGLAGAGLAPFIAGGAAIAAGIGAFVGRRRSK